MILKNFIYLLSALFFLLSACSLEEVSEQELKEYISDQENGLKKREDIKDGFIELVYKPTDLLIAMNYKEEVTGKGKLDSLRGKVSRYLYFTVRISKENREIETFYIPNQAVYQEVVNYLSHYMGEDISMETEGNSSSIPVADYHYMSMFGTTEATTLLVAFEMKQVEKEDKFSVRIDGSKLGIGIQVFDFKTADILKIPKIKFI